MNTVELVVIKTNLKSPAEEEIENRDKRHHCNSDHD